MKKAMIAVSIEPAKKDPVNYVKAIEKEIDFVHCDIMDGLFVENKCLDENVVKLINDNSLVPLDVHLMTVKPNKLIKTYAKAGANIITVHYEAFNNVSQLKKCLKYINELNILAGISIKPETPIKSIEKILPYVDIVLVMSVEPGKSGQSFLENSVGRIKTLSQLRLKNGYHYLIEVDGGINADNSHIILSNGADIIVSGSYIFNAKDYQKAISDLLNK